MKVTYRNKWTGAIFTVIGRDAIARIDKLASWVRPDMNDD